MRPVWPILLAVVATGCVGARRETLRGLAVGHFVEAKGDFQDGRALVREIDEIPRGPDDKADKVEVTGPAEDVAADAVRVLGHDFAIDAETTYEGEDKLPRPRFEPRSGDWLRLKARDKGEQHRVRTLRAMPTREQFKVTGEVRSIDPTAATFDVGGIVLPAAQGVGLSPASQAKSDDPLQLFLGEDQKAVPFSVKLTERISLGGQAAGELEWNDEYDLSRANSGDRTKPKFRGRTAGLWLIDDAGSYAMTELAFGRDDTIREQGETTYTEVLEATRAFVSLNPSSSLQILAGRQDFDEEREWLYDEVLDGVRAVWRVGRCEFEIGHGQGRELFAERNSYEETGVWIANARCWLDPDTRIGAYVLQRTDKTTAGFEPLLAGIRSLAQPRYGLGHWAELGVARGQIGTRRVEGWAFDVGGLWSFDVPLRPTFGAGVAYGSGQRDGADEIGYRQSGLNDNNSKLGGVTSLRYYGELFDPELANIGITTLTASIRPFEGASATLVFHTYRQDVASATTPNTDLRTTPTGRSADLGRELDLVLGYRFGASLTLEVIAARFEPGSAWATDSAAHLLVITSRLSF